MRKPVLKQAPSGELYTTESELQKTFVRYFRTVFASFKKLLFSIPNGAKMGGRVGKSGHPIQASIMISEGLTAGVADLFLSIPGSGLHGLYIETKTPVGTWEADQKEFFRAVTSMQYGYVICRTLSQFEKAINDYLTNNYEQENNEQKVNKGYKVAA